MKSTIPPATSSAAASRVANSFSTHGRRATYARIAVAAFFVGFLLIQLAAPVAQVLWAPRPARFGWQMFSVSLPPPTFTLVLDDGSSRPAKIEPFVASLRADVPLAKFLPPHLCRVVPHVVAVRIQAPNADRPEVYQCSR